MMMLQSWWRWRPQEGLIAISFVRQVLQEWGNDVDAIRLRSSRRHPERQTTTKPGL
jgi:hypothetical protein